MTFTNILISTAFAQAEAAAPAASPANGFMLQLPMILGMLALAYFVIIRPQKTQQKKQIDFLMGLNRGDEVVTSSGIIGKIVGLTDRVITLEVAQGTELKILKTQVNSYLKDSLAAPQPASQA